MKLVEIREPSATVYINAADISVVQRDDTPDGVVVNDAMYRSSVVVQVRSGLIYRQYFSSQETAGNFLADLLSELDPENYGSAENYGGAT